MTLQSPPQTFYDQLMSIGGDVTVAGQEEILLIYVSKGLTSDDRET